jgi:hypothetical protein
MDVRPLTADGTGDPIDGQILGNASRIAEGVKTISFAIV